MNALKHGLLAQQVVLPSEDEEEFLAFSLGLEQQLQPAGELEGWLVDCIAAYAWRLRRLIRIEKGILIRYTFEQAVEEAEEDAAEQGEQRQSMIAKVFGVLKDMTPETPQVAEAAVAALNEIVAMEARQQEAETRAEEAERARNGTEGALGLAFMTAALETDAFAKLSRYESHIQRSMFRALTELERIQTARGKDEPARSSQAPPSLELEEEAGMDLADAPFE
jgi:hypothetical protein